MQIIDNPHIMAFDLDDTLIIWTDEGFYVSQEHVDEMRRAALRGQFVVVWTRAPLPFARKVLEDNDLVKFVNILQNKPEFYWDDRPADGWMARCYHDPNKEE